MLWPRCVRLAYQLFFYKLMDTKNRSCHTSRYLCRLRSRDGTGGGRRIFHALPVGVDCLLDGGFFYDSLFATVVAAFAAYCVVDVPGTAVGAESQSGSYSLVVSTALCGTGFGLLSFRMCHFSLLLLILFYNILWRGGYFRFYSSPSTDSPFSASQRGSVLPPPASASTSSILSSSSSCSSASSPGVTAR